MRFNKFPSIQYTFWVSLVLWNRNNGEHCWLGNGPEDYHWGSLLKGVAVQECCIKAYQMQSWLEGRNWVGKCPQATGSLRILSRKADSNTWESLTRSELKLESVHQESPHSDIFRKRATKPLLKQKHRQKHLTRATEKKNWTVAQWSKVLFSDESKFCI